MALYKQYRIAKKDTKVEKEEEPERKRYVDFFAHKKTDSFPSVIPIVKHHSTLPSEASSPISEYPLIRQKYNKYAEKRLKSHLKVLDEVIQFHPKIFKENDIKNRHLIIYWMAQWIKTMGFKTSFVEFKKRKKTFRRLDKNWDNYRKRKYYIVKMKYAVENFAWKFFRISNFPWLEILKTGPRIIKSTRINEEKAYWYYVIERLIKYLKKIEPESKEDYVICGIEYEKELQNLETLFNDIREQYKVNKKGLTFGEQLGKEQHIDNRMRESHRAEFIVNIYDSERMKSIAAYLTGELPLPQILYLVSPERTWCFHPPTKRTPQKFFKGFLLPNFYINKGFRNKPETIYVKEFLTDNKIDYKLPLIMKTSMKLVSKSHISLIKSSSDSTKSFDDSGKSCSDFRKSRHDLSLPFDVYEFLSCESDWFKHSVSPEKSYPFVVHTKDKKRLVTKIVTKNFHGAFQNENLSLKQNFNKMKYNELFVKKFKIYRYPFFSTDRYINYFKLIQPKCNKNIKSFSTIDPDYISSINDINKRDSQLSIRSEFKSSDNSDIMGYRTCFKQKYRTVQTLDAQIYFKLHDLNSDYNNNNKLQAQFNGKDTDKSLQTESNINSIKIDETLSIQSPVSSFKSGEKKVTIKKVINKINSRKSNKRYLLNLRNIRRHLKCKHKLNDDELNDESETSNITDVGKSKKTTLIKKKTTKSEIINSDEMKISESINILDEASKKLNLDDFSLKTGSTLSEASVNLLRKYFGKIVNDENNELTTAESEEEEESVENVELEKISPDQMSINEMNLENFKNLLYVSIPKVTYKTRFMRHKTIILRPEYFLEYAAPLLFRVNTHGKVLRPLFNQFRYNKFLISVFDPNDPSRFNEKTIRSSSISEYVLEQLDELNTKSKQIKSLTDRQAEEILKSYHRKIYDPDPYRKVAVNITTKSHKLINVGKKYYTMNPRKAFPLKFSESEKHLDYHFGRKILKYFKDLWEDETITHPPILLATLNIPHIVDQIQPECNLRHFSRKKDWRTLGKPQFRINGKKTTNKSKAMNITRAKPARSLIAPKKDLYQIVSKAIHKKLHGNDKIEQQELQARQLQAAKKGKHGNSQPEIRAERKALLEGTAIKKLLKIHKRKVKLVANLQLLKQEFSFINSESLRSKFKEALKIIEMERKRIESEREKKIKDWEQKHLSPGKRSKLLLEIRKEKNAISEGCLEPAMEESASESTDNIINENQIDTKEDIQDIIYGIKRKNEKIINRNRLKLIKNTKRLLKYLHVIDSLEGRGRKPHYTGRYFSIHPRYYLKKKKRRTKEIVITFGEGEQEDEKEKILKWKSDMERRKRLTARTKRRLEEKAKRKADRLKQGKNKRKNYDSEEDETCLFLAWSSVGPKLPFFRMSKYFKKRKSKCINIKKQKRLQRYNKWLIYKYRMNKKKLYRKKHVQFGTEVQVIDDQGRLISNKLEDIPFGDRFREDGESVQFTRFVKMKAPTVCIFGTLETWNNSDNIDWFVDNSRLNFTKKNLYGKGIEKCKGPLMAWLFGVKSLIERRGRLPVNLKLVINSFALTDSVLAIRYLKRIIPKFLKNVDYVMFIDAISAGKSSPSIVYASRGLCHFQIDITNNDSNAAIRAKCSKNQIPDLVSDMIYMMDKIEGLPDVFKKKRFTKYTELGRVTLDHFKIYEEDIDKRQEPTTPTATHVCTTEFIEKLKKSPLQVENLNLECDHCRLKANEKAKPSALPCEWFLPTFTLHGFEIMKTIQNPRENMKIPTRVKGSFSVHYLNNISPAWIKHIIKTYMQTKWNERQSSKSLNPNLCFAITMTYSSMPWVANTCDPLVNKVKQILTKLYGIRESYYSLEPTSSPFVSLIQMLSNIPICVIAFPNFCNSSEYPNKFEKFSIDSFKKATSMSIALIRSFACIMDKRKFNAIVRKSEQLNEECQKFIEVIKNKNFDGILNIAYHGYLHRYHRHHEDKPTPLSKIELIRQNGSTFKAFGYIKGAELSPDAQKVEGVSLEESSSVMSLDYVRSEISVESDGDLKYPIHPKEQYQAESIYVANYQNTITDETLEPCQTFIKTMLDLSFRKDIEKFEELCGYAIEDFIGDELPVYPIFAKRKQEDLSLIGGPFKINNVDTYFYKFDSMNFPPHLLPISHGKSAPLTRSLADTKLMVENELKLQLFPKKKEDLLSLFPQQLPYIGPPQGYPSTYFHLVKKKVKGTKKHATTIGNKKKFKTREELLKELQIKKEDEKRAEKIKLKEIIAERKKKKMAGKKGKTGEIIEREDDNGEEKMQRESAGKLEKLDEEENDNIGIKKQQLSVNESPKQLMAPSCEQVMNSINRYLWSFKEKLLDNQDIEEYLKKKIFRYDMKRRTEELSRQEKIDILKSINLKESLLPLYLMVMRKIHKAEKKRHQFKKQQARLKSKQTESERKSAASRTSVKTKTKSSGFTKKHPKKGTSNNKIAKKKKSLVKIPVGKGDKYISLFGNLVNSISLQPKLTDALAKVYDKPRKVLLKKPKISKLILGPQISVDSIIEYRGPSEDMDDEKSVKRSEDRLSLMETRSRYSRYSSTTTLDSIGKKSGRFIQVGRSAAQYNIYKKTVSNRNYQGLSRAKVICKLKTMPLQYYQRIKTKQFLRERAFKKPKKNYTKVRDKLLDEKKDEPTNVKPLDTNKSPIWDRIETLIFKAAAKKAGIGVDKYEIIKNSLVNKKFNFLDYEKILQLFSSRSLDDLFMKPNNGLFDQDKLAASCITYKYRPEPMKIMQLPTIYPENMSIKNLFPETPAEEFESKMEQSLIQHYLKNADTSIIHKNEAIRRNARAAVITYLVANKPLQICKQPFDIFMRDIPYPRLTRNLKKSVIPRWKSAWNQLPKLTLDTRGYKMVGKINSDAQTEWKFTDLAEHFYFYKKLNKDFRKDDLEATIEAEENDRVLFGKAKRWRSKNIIKYNPPNSKFVTISRIKQEVKKILKRQTKSTQTLLGKPYLTPLRVNSPFIREPKYMTALEVVHFGELIKEPRLSSENESKSVKKYKYSVGKLSPTEKVRAIQECHQRRRDIAKKRSLKKMNYKSTLDFPATRTEQKVRSTLGEYASHPEP